MQHARAAVVAEAGPGGEDVCLRGEGESDGGGEAPQELLVVGDDGGDSGLLEHDLGDPGAVGIADAAPGQLARMGAVPVHELATQEGRVRGDGVCVGSCVSQLVEFVIHGFGPGVNMHR